VPPEVFRLVLRLEAQKALDVNVAALEQRFRVPPGYADDDSLNARGELKQPKDVCLLPCTDTSQVWRPHFIVPSCSSYLVQELTKCPINGRCGM
jgi:hypothetical protein